MAYSRKESRLDPGLSMASDRPLVWGSHEESQKVPRTFCSPRTGARRADRKRPYGIVPVPGCGTGLWQDSYRQPDPYIAVLHCRYQYSQPGYQLS